MSNKARHRRIPRHDVERSREHRSSMVAYGARCSWWDDKQKVATKPSGLPCCPHCGGVVFESDAATFYEGARTYQDDGHPGYVAWLDWLRGKCYPSLDHARAAYEAEGAS